MRPVASPAPRPRWPLLTALAVAVLLLSMRGAVLGPIDLVQHDLIARLLPQRASSPPADHPVVVAIDDDSLAALGRWPWPRAQHAELIDALHAAGVRAIGYGVMFSEPSDLPDDDGRLAAAIARHGQVVLPVQPVIDRGTVRLLQPLPALVQAARALGHAEAPVDPDGRLRRIARIVGSGSAGWLSLPHAVHALGAPATSLPAPPGDGLEAWWRQDLWLLPGGMAAVPEISAATVLGEPGSAALLRGRTVWVGVTAGGIGPTLSVPVAGEARPLATVQWQARLHRALQDGALVRPLEGVQIWAANLLPLLLMLLAPVVRPRLAGRLSARILLAMVPAVVLAEGLGLMAGVWMPMSALMLALGAGAMVARTLDLHRTRTDLRRERRLADVTLKAITDAVITLDAQGRVSYVNPVAQQFAGRTAVQARLLPVADLLDTPPVDARLLRQTIEDCRSQRRTVEIDLPLHLATPTGERMVRTVVSPLPARPGQVPGVVIVLSDVTDAIHARQRIEHDATHDALTGLPNRALLSDRLARALASARHRGASVAVLFIDLDRFDRFNASLGQQGGDRILQLIAQRLTEACREPDAVARWGNDQFVALLEDVSGQEPVAAAAARCVEQVARELRIDDAGLDIACTCSIGIALGPGPEARAPDDLLSLAAAALARAKASGGGRFEFHGANPAGRALDWLALEHRLRRALDADEFVLHYQLQADLATGRPVGMEALLRWRQPDGELWAPSRFLAITEETGLIVSVGHWVIREAVTQQARWRAQGVPLVPVSVNVSARQCVGAGLVEAIERTLRDAAVPASLLKIEITETTAMADPDHLRHLLARLRGLGVAVALDDFGTGFSSLEHLRRFPVDQIKIDPSFVADMLRDRSGAAIVRATIALAHGLGVPVVAEGVENAAQLEFLRRHRCDIVQGYVFSRPAAAAGVGQTLITSADALPHCLLPG
ncbi:MAG: hypothetical protein RL456_2997 [Pseudomonadota bacterium]|jgi:diguanylate cyclase (GGDEF)-like protein/PAS domain S-box-containing protein